MALHINLYHEIHKQAQRERRDPVKLASLGAVLLLICLVGWYFFRTSSAREIEVRRNQLKDQWAKVEPQLKQAIENEPKWLNRQQTNKELIERLQGRFYWAPLLEKFQALVPSNVQILSLEGDTGEGRGIEKGTTQPALSLLVRGVAAGVMPRAAAEEFRRSLQTGFAELYSEVSAGFDANSLEDGLEVVQLNGQTLGTANFRIRVLFKPTPTPAATPAVTPTGRKAK